MQSNSNQISRQNSSPHLGRSTARAKAPSERSKTPPPKFPGPPQSTKTQQCQTLPRNLPKKHLIPNESSSKSTSSKCSSIPDISKDVVMDAKYNLYCQANLVALHSKSLKGRNESKLMQEMVKLEARLLDLDEKMSTLDTNLEKKQFYEKARFNLQEEIRSYEKIINEIDEDKLDEYIRIWEQDLGSVQLRNFDLPKDEEETKEILKTLEGINENLEQISEVEKKILPFTQLHSSWLEGKRNVQKEKELENICAKELRLAEKLIYDLCFVKSIDYQSMSEADSQN